MVNMGKIISRLTRPIRLISIDQRAEKVISQSKATPAPMYPSTKKQLEIAKQLNPTFMEDHYKKDKNLDTNLKHVYITSEDPQLEIKSTSTSDKPLPQDRKISPEFEYGMWEPESVPPGKITFSKFLEMLAAHNLNPLVYNKKKLAKMYKLDPLVVEKMLSYYKIFTKYEPKSSTDHKRLLGEKKSIHKKLESYTQNLLKEHKPDE